MPSSTYVLTDGEDNVVKYPYSIRQLISDNPTISFALPVSEETAAQYNVFLVEDSPAPDFDRMTQNQKLDFPVIEDGVWQQKWSITDASDAEKEERITSFRAGLSCSPLQGKIALNNAGFLDDVESAVSISDKNTQLAWNNATIWMRTSALISTLGTTIGFSPEELDNLFLEAQKISV